MKFHIPEKITVAGVDFKVSDVKGLGRNDSRRGETQYFDRELRLDPDLDSQSKEQTFIPEVSHAIDDTYDCKLSESQIRRMSHGFYQVLRQLKSYGEEEEEHGTS